MAETEVSGQDSLQEQVRKLARDVVTLARNRLTVDLRYMANPISMLALEEAPGLDNVMTDGRKLWYDPIHLLRTYSKAHGMPAHQYLHLVLHCVYQHFYINSLIDRPIWDIACDIAVEASIPEDAVPSASVPGSASRQREIEKIKKHVPHMTAEFIYRYLREKGVSADELRELQDLFSMDTHDAWYGSSGSDTEDSDEEKEENSENRSRSQKTKRQEKRKNRDNDEDSGDEPQQAGSENEVNAEEDGESGDEFMKEAGAGGTGEDGGEEQDSEGSSGSPGGQSGEDGGSEEQQQGQAGDGEGQQSQKGGATQGTGNAQGQNVQGGDEDAPGRRMSLGELEALRSDWKRAAEQMCMDIEAFHSSAEQGAGAGSMVANLHYAVREKYDYAAFLRQFSVLGETMRINDEEFDYSFYCYGIERYGNMPLIEPLEYKDVHKLREFVIAIDTSGSTSGELVQTFLRKTYNILMQRENFHTKVNVRIIQCDAKIQEDVKITNRAEFEAYMKNLKVRGMGGTDFRPVFSHVNDLIRSGELQKLKGLIYFTDGYGVFPAQQPPYKTAFVFIDEGYEQPEIPVWAIRLVLEPGDIDKIRESDAEVYA